MARVLHGARVLYILRIVRRVLGNVRELDAFHVTILHHHHHNTMNKQTRQSLKAAGIQTTQHRARGARGKRCLHVITLGWDGCWDEERNFTANKRSLGRIIRAMVAGKEPF